MRIWRKRVAEPVKPRSLDDHPWPEPHPWGEDRTWCSRCGRPAYVDDLSFHVWHIGGENGRMSPAHDRCTLALAHV